MRAARDFVQRLSDQNLLAQCEKLTCVLYGSLGSTGIGHGTPGAVVAGLSGLYPETCLPIKVRHAWSALETGPRILLGGTHSMHFSQQDIQFQPRTRLPGHPNALTFRAFTDSGDLLSEETYFSIGGGFIRREGEDTSATDETQWPFPFASSSSLMKLCEQESMSIDQIALANELSQRSAEEVTTRLDAIWNTMHRCVETGLHGAGELPGGLHVKRRAAEMREHLTAADERHDRDTTTEWLHAFALAVNEENAAGGRVVTAPTNGAAGIVPAVASYYLRFVEGANQEGIRRYLLTATAIGSLFKANASISGAEAGCQGEIGPACAMAAGGLCAVLGGTPRQVENAAEIAMEHHLGLTCDPVGGLVQIPCIERNAIAASTAVSAARLALHGDGSHVVSLDAVIETMRQTGLDMSTKYKETSEGGLAVNVIEC